MVRITLCVGLWQQWLHGKMIVDFHDFDLAEITNRSQRPAQPLHLLTSWSYKAHDGHDGLQLLVSYGIMPHHGISWHIMASGCNIHAPILQVEGGTMEELQRELEAGRFREIPGDSGRSFFRSWLQLVVVSVILGFVLLYWLTSVGVNIFKWNICETHTFICSIIYYI